MFTIKNNLGPLTAIIAFLDSLNQLSLSALENLTYGFLGAAYFVGGMATLLVGGPCLIDKIFNK